MLAEGWPERAGRDRTACGGQGEVRIMITPPFRGLYKISGFKKAMWTTSPLFEIRHGVKLNFAEFPWFSMCCGEYGWDGEFRGGKTVIKSGLTGAGRAMAPRTPSLAERLAEPWEGV